MDDFASRFRPLTLRSPTGTTHHVDSLRSLRDLARVHLGFSNGFLLMASAFDLYDAFHLRGWTQA